MQIKETDLGFEIDTPEYLFFFGKKNSDLNALKKNYSQFEFRCVKQVHGSEIYRQLDIADTTVEADGQWTKMSKLALAISTADCVPVMIVHPSRGMVMGLHAGWRGVAARIIPKGLLLFQEHGAKPEEVFALIGPHIQQRSFEVGEDVKAELLTSAGLAESSDDKDIAISSGKPGKYHVDLNAIVKIQLSEFSLSPDQLFDLHLDTFTDTRFHSFRRDKDKAGRQLSFVVKK